MWFMAKGWMRVAGFGYGVMLSLAMRGGLQWYDWLSGTQLNDRIGGHVWLIGCLTLGPLLAWWYPNVVKASPFIDSEPSESGAPN